MSEQLNDKQNGAIRLFGALSGVDEKYLAACEDDRGTASKGVVVFMQKYGKGMAAVLCLAVLGAGYMSMQETMGTDMAASVVETPANQAIASDQECASAASSETVMEPEAAYEEAAMDGAAENGTVSGASDLELVREETDSAKVELEGQQPAARVDELKEAICKTVESVSEDMLVEMSLEQVQALDVIGKYIPMNWPAGGALTKVVGCDVSGAEFALMEWAYDNQRNSFVIDVSCWEGDVPDEVKRGLEEEGDIVYQEDFTREYMESRIKISPEDTLETELPRGHFGILYKDGTNYVLVRFDGFAKLDDIWELMN